MIGLERLVGCQHGDVHKMPDLGHMGNVRARKKNFRITFLEVLFGAVEVDAFSKKNAKRKMESLRSL